MNVFNIERAFKRMREEKWPKMYWAIDFHDVLFKGYYKIDQSHDIYPGAIEVLKNLTKRKDMVLIGYTSSHYRAFKLTNMWLWLNHEVQFNYLNCNPECGTTDLADFRQKFYYNILLDDKAGFVGETDWKLIKKELKRIGEWKQE